MILFISTFLSPHIKPLCDYLYEHTKSEFRYIQTMQLTAERKAMGYEFNEKIPYLMNYADCKEECSELIENAECVILNPGSADVMLVKERIKNNKVTFFISERIFKIGIIKFLDPRVLKTAKVILSGRKKKLFLLCLGGFVGKDYRKLGFCKDKIYRFGYFPDLYNTQKTYRNNEKIELVWVGRMISWKRPQLALKIVNKLKKKGKDCHLTMVGDGCLFDKVKEKVKKLNLGNEISLLGIQDNETVRKLMLNADALIVTSNRREGWGAVLNEAFSSETPVVSCKDVGAAAYLIKDGYNGYTYKSRDVKTAVKGIEKIKENSANYKKNINETMDLWNADVAGERFLNVLEKIYEDCENNEIYSQGPMSKE